MKCTNCGKFEASIGDWCWRCDDDGTYALYETRAALEKEIGSCAYS